MEDDDHTAIRTSVLLLLATAFVGTLVVSIEGVCESSCTASSLARDFGGLLAGVFTLVAGALAWFATMRAAEEPTRQAAIERIAGHIAQLSRLRVAYSRMSRSQTPIEGRRKWAGTIRSRMDSTPLRSFNLDLDVGKEIEIWLLLQRRLRKALQEVNGPGDGFISDAGLIPVLFFELEGALIKRRKLLSSGISLRRARRQAVADFDPSSEMPPTWLRNVLREMDGSDTA